MINILCADIGGTNSRFAHFTLDEAEPGGLKIGAIRWIATESAGSLADQLRTLYGGDFPLPPAKTDLAVLAVAGPVSEGSYSKLPLVGWEVDLAKIGREFPFASASLINDFTAQALAVLAPPGAAAREILPGQPTADGAVALIGAGRTREILLTARLIGAEEAHAIGLVSESVDDFAALQTRAADLGRTLAGYAPLTIQATKEALRRLRLRGAEADDHDLITLCYMSDDFREGQAAFLEKRPPVWKGR